MATLARVFGDIDLAEDAVQEAFAVAIERWPADGLPPNPGGWIVTTARNKALDRLRRESTQAGPGGAGGWRSLGEPEPERRRDQCATTSCASSSPAATRRSPRRRGSR